MPNDCVRGGRERLSRRKAAKKSSAVARNRGAAASFKLVEQGRELAAILERDRLVNFADPGHRLSISARRFVKVNRPQSLAADASVLRDRGFLDGYRPNSSSYLSKKGPDATSFSMD